MNRKQRRAAGKPVAPTAGADPLSKIPPPSNAMLDRQFALAMQNLQGGRLDLAEAGLRQLLQAAPKHPDALNALGFVLHRTGAHEPAMVPIQAALAIRPGFADAHATLGSVYQSLGRNELAIASYRQAIALAPRFSGALSNLGNVLQAIGRLDEAVDCYRRALAINANDAMVQSNLGSALKALGRLDEAIGLFERALGLRPDLMEARLNLANAWLVQGKFEQAGTAYEDIARLRPDLPGVHSNLGMVLRTQGRMTAAIDAYRRSLAVHPNDPAAHANLGNVLADIGRLDEAQASYERAVALKPDYAEMHSSILMLLNYQPSVTTAALVDAHRAFDRTVALLPPPAEPTNSADPERRLRIGYVSSDYGAHPVGYFMLPVLAAHDPAQVALHCYSGRLTEDAITARLRQPAEIWRSTVGLSDAAMVEQIRSDRIDLLIDLNGHTAGSRLTAFAHRPAPVQVTWLGYPATTGLAAIDYRLTDAIADPAPLADGQNVETLLRLPRGFHCYVPPEPAPAVAPLSADAQGAVTFGSFNNLAKLNDAVIAAWARVVSAVPGSRLLLKARPLNDPATRADYQARFEAAGILADRLILQSTAASWTDHMAHYAAVDIGLDPFPYNGTTTTCDALWMGVPVVTLRGDRHASRVGASLLGQLGLDELVADDLAGYIATAASLAADRPRLAALRAGLRDRLAGSPLGDAAGFTRALENAYRDIWRRWCARRHA